MTSGFSSNQLPSPSLRPDSARVWRLYAQTGHGSSAEDQLIEENLPLVKTVLGRLAVTLPPASNLKDLQSAGVRGLLNAIRRFNPRTGASFPSQARASIQAAVLDELRRQGDLPADGSDASQLLQLAMRDLEVQKGSPATEEELADALQLPLHKYQELLAEVRTDAFVTLDAAADLSETPLTDVSELTTDSTHFASAAGMATLLADRMERLPELERQILALYYCEDLRLAEIAEVFGLSEDRVAQVHAQAILRLKSCLPASRELTSPALSSTHSLRALGLPAMSLAPSASEPVEMTYSAPLR
jgi:RNA polymerase sigma factor for flagellar operon FliA